jgi:hypothetical protein
MDPKARRPGEESFPHTHRSSQSHHSGSGSVGRRRPAAEGDVDR